VDPKRCQQVCRRIITTVSHWRRTNTRDAQALLRGWLAASVESLSVQDDARRAPRLGAATRVRGAGVDLISFGGTHALSAGGPAGTDSGKDSPHAHSNHIAHAGVAGAAVTRSSDAPCEPIATSRAEPERSMGWAQSFEPEMEITVPQDEHGLPRIRGALSFALLAAHVDVRPEPLTAAPISDIAVPSDVRDGLLTAFLTCLRQVPGVRASWWPRMHGRVAQCRPEARNGSVT
jgi:hypothetical protein